MIVNHLYSGCPESTSFTDADGSSHTILGVTGYEYTETGANFANFSDDHSRPMDGGGTNVTGQLSLTMIDLANIEDLRGGMKVTGVTLEMAGRGDSTDDMTLTLARGRVNNIRVGGNQGPEPSTLAVAFDAYSTDGESDSVSFTFN